MLASKLKFSSVSICKMSSALELSRLLQFVVPNLSPERHKGQAGKIAVIGGCREYTGAPYFSAISALKVGADLSHVFCSKGAGTVIKSYSPELIVHPILVESYDMDPVKNDVEGILGEFMKWLPRFDCLVVGPGLGRDPLLLNSVSQIICQARKSNVPIVLDGDGLFLVTNNPELVSGYALAILTPNVNEHKRLVEKVLGEEHDNKESDASEQLMSLAARLGGVTIVQKGVTDLISDGNTVYAMSLLGSPRRCGGQGDVLSGSIAVFTAWSKAFFSEEKRNMGSDFPTAINNILQKSSSNPAMLGGIAGSFLVRAAAAEAYEKHKRSTLTTDIINCLGTSMDKYFPIKET